MFTLDHIFTMKIHDLCSFTVQKQVRAGIRWRLEQLTGRTSGTLRAVH